MLGFVMGKRNGRAHGFGSGFVEQDFFKSD